MATLIIGQNDLQTKHPDIAAQWHPTQNGPLTPQDVTCGTHKKVWWQCEHGHEWEASIVNRVKGNGCPYCSGYKSIAGKTDLATKHPEIAAQWHPVKNGNRTPQDVSVASGKKVWWQCELGHEWEAIIKNRTLGSSGCPYCSGLRAVPDETDLVTKVPEIAAQWHPDKNGSLTPQEVAPQSRKKVWWQCKLGHEWEARVHIRTTQKSGCPYCSGLRAVPGETDLTTKYPNIAAQWHPTKNAELTPKDVTVGSRKKVWWLGACGHEWEAVIQNRTLNETGCPYCSGLRAVPGKTDLATKYPDIAAQWHPTKNAELTPKDVTAGSGKKVWWRCAHGHEWEAKICDRTTKGYGCPECKKMRLSNLV